MFSWVSLIKYDPYKQPRVRLYESLQNAIKFNAYFAEVMGDICFAGQAAVKAIVQIDKVRLLRVLGES